MRHHASALNILSSPLNVAPPMSKQYTVLQVGILNTHNNIIRIQYTRYIVVLYMHECMGYDIVYLISPECFASKWRTYRKCM